jgi:sulfatase modifying factor 1
LGQTPVVKTTPTQAENEGYLAATQTPDGVIHLISSRLPYRFNLASLVADATSQP